MKVVFVMIGFLPYAAKMVASVRRQMPGVEIVQFSDTETPQVEGTDAVTRHPYDGYLMTFRLARLAEFAGEFISLDTDCIVRRDLRPVFAEPFDVALTYRNGRIFDPTGRDMTELMPINSGVIFSRSSGFWHDCLAACQKMHPKDREWWGDQLAISDVVKTGRYNVKRLECNEWNYSPKRPDEDFSQRAVVHYKGKRKDWMP